MNYYKKMMIIIFIVVFNIACSNEQDKKSPDMISGNSSKTWREVQATNPDGHKEKLTEAEKNEVIQFYSNGNFVMKSSNSSNVGTWFYDQAANSIGLNFGGANFTEYYTVLELGKNKMRLKGRDGSVLFLKSERG